MQIVTIHRGKFKGAAGLVDVSGKQAPVVNAAISEDAIGKFIEVNGEVVIGLPRGRRSIKIYLDSEQDFTVSESTLEDLTKHNLIVKALKAEEKRKAKMISDIVRVPKVEAPTASQDPQSFINTLNGPDDAIVKARIGDAFDVLDYLVQSAADGQINGVIVSGPPGVGKSTEVEMGLMRVIEQPDVVKRLQWKPSYPGEQLPVVDTTKYKEQFDLRYKWISGKVSPVGLYELLWKSSDERSVLVFDDTDCVLQDETMLGFMKIAMDTSGKPRVMTWSSSFTNRMEAPPRFVFKGTIIIITNINFEAQSQKENSLTEHLNALMDRTYYLDLTIHSLREKYLWIDYQCRDNDVLEKIGLAPVQVSEVMDYFKRNILNFRHVSIRTVEKIGRLCLTHGNWQRMCEVTMFSTKNLIAHTRIVEQAQMSDNQQPNVTVTDPSEIITVNLISALAKPAEQVIENQSAMVG